MAGNIQNVSFASPTSLIAPDLVAQQQANQQQLALAQALREQSLDDIKVDPGSHVSWTQGLAKIAEALAAKREFSQANKQTGQMAQRYGKALGGMFGSQPQPVQTSPAPTDQVSNVPADVSPVALPQSSSPQQGVPQQLGAALAGSGQPETRPAPPPQAAQPQASQPGPWSLTGNPQQDMQMYEMNPEEYGKAVIANHTPVDLAKTVEQAREAMSRGDMATASALLQNVQKQNNIPLVAGRPGAAMWDANHNIVGVNPQNIEGANPDIQNGQFTGSYSQAPGAAGAIASAAAAKAGGAATYKPMTAFDPNTGAPIITTDALASQAATGGHPLQGGAGLGQAAAANVTGTNSANAFQDISNGAADVPNRIYALKNMQTLANDPRSQFGAGAEGTNEFRGKIATLSQSMGLATPDPAVATNANEFQKWATQYSARSGQELGLSGSDARTQLAVHATPNGEMTRSALQSVIPQMVGIENAKQGYANAANVWQQSHGPQTVQQFRTEWNANYDPRIYTWLSQGSVKQNMAALQKSSPAEYHALIRKAQVLGNIGAIPQ